VINLIHRSGQWFFLRVEGFFNLAFGERLNPLYYLGAISYWLMWVVVGSGLYLYILFKTGVAEAYASVEYLTHGQPYVGGVLREKCIELYRRYSDQEANLMLGV